MSKTVKLGNKVLGGENPILIQSMVNIKTSKIAEVVEQIKELKQLDATL